MSRNGSGTYSLPAGQPVVTGTTISAATFNTLTADLATEMTDSLDRSGKGGMLAQFAAINGTVAAPAISFTNDAGSGLYRIGSNDIGFAINGSKVMEWTATATTIVQATTFSAAVTVTGALTASAAATVGTTLGVTGATTLSTLAVTSTTALTGDLAINTNKFNVTAASGNTLVAGTLGVTGVITASGGIAAGSARITLVADPSSAQDAATKNYVDTAGLAAWSNTGIVFPTHWPSGSLKTLVTAGTVRFQGFMQANAGAAGATLITLPAGQRPSAQVTLAAPCLSGGGVTANTCTLFIATNGVVTISTVGGAPGLQSNSDQVNLDGVSFMTI